MSTQATGGKDTGTGSFYSRAQGAADTNENAKTGGRSGQNNNSGGGGVKK
ncbi:hypothetical protein BC567DRAFT_259716 [Phyllosticta citribraziliensis]